MVDSFALGKIALYTLGLLPCGVFCSFPACIQHSLSSGHPPTQYAQSVVILQGEQLAGAVTGKIWCKIA